MLEPGRTIGRYTVQTQIGQGGMATVYRALDLDGQAWALKVLIQRNDDLRERFCQEAEIQCALDHPHIVRGRERIFVDDDPALVMELIEGKPLDAWLLQDYRAFTDPTAIRDRDRISRQMVDAVGFAHAHGLIHRDLKPGNILIEDRFEGPFAKVTDFGLAKQVHGLASTRTGIALGTPRYMAPEQIRDAKRVDARADIWSLGAVLFEMYSGRPAFHRDALIDIYTAVTDGVYTDPATLGVPARVCDAIRGALKVDLDARFRDCRALLFALGVEPSFPPGELPLPVLGSLARQEGKQARPAPMNQAFEAPATLLVPERVALALAPTLISPPRDAPPTLIVPNRAPHPAYVSPSAPPPAPALLLPGSRPGEELPSADALDESSSVTLLPVSDPELELDHELEQELAARPMPPPRPPPPPRNAALIVASPLPVRRRRPKPSPWPVVTWIVAWVAALLLVVGTFVTGMVVVGGLVTVNELLDDQPVVEQPRKAPRRGPRHR